MAVTVANSGTQLAVISTEHSLDTDTTNATYVFAVDTANMVAGDVVELRVKTRVLTGGSDAVAYYATYANAQADNIKFSPPVPSPFNIEVTLKQTAGTGRNFDWSLIRL